MIKKFICLTAFAATLFPLAIQAQLQEDMLDNTVSTVDSLQKGNIKAFLVKGKVTITDTFGKTTPLKRGAIFRDGTTINTGKDATAVVILSNGSSIRLGPNSELKIDEFEQESFDPSAGSYLTLVQDPSKSVTKVSLQNGMIAGETKHLSSSSEYVVNTPVGSAGIRGTKFGAEVSSTTEGGQTIYTTTFAKENGTVTFTTPDGSSSGELGDGEQITIIGEVIGDAAPTITSVSQPGPINPVMDDLLKQPDPADPGDPTASPPQPPTPETDPVIEVSPSN